MQLQGCFECTDWDIFKETSVDIDELTDVISSYVTFCEDNVIPLKTFKTFPNNKPWVLKSLKMLLSKKRKLFREGNLSELNLVKREIKCKIRRAKLNYRDRLEGELRQNKLRSVWDGLKTITGTKRRSNSRISLNGVAISDKHLAQDLNSFYLRFDTYNFSNEILTLKKKLQCTRSPLNELSVVQSFRRTKVRKSPGPDSICGRLLHSCAEQLGPIFFDIFQMSINQQRVPKSWKNSTIINLLKGS